MTRALVRGTPLLAASLTATDACFHQTSGLRHPDTRTFEDLLVAGAAWVLVLAAGWTAVVLAAAVLEVASAGRLALTSRLGCRGPVRRALLSALGVVLAGGGALVAGPVSAAPAPYDQGLVREGAGHGPTLPPPARPTGSTHAEHPRRVEVRPGDSLWRLSRQRAPTATTGEVVRLVDRAYVANRQVIGPDPDLIRPGQRLLLPRPRPHAPANLDPYRETP